MKDRRDDERDLSEHMAFLVSKLETEAQKRVSRRYQIELRWLEDLRQYHGRYDEETERRLIESEASAVFINLTQAKTDALTARMYDLIFATDDRSWSIGPTPVPELSDMLDEAIDTLMQSQAALEHNRDRLADVVAEGGSEAPEAPPEEEAEGEAPMDALDAPQEGDPAPGGAGAADPQEEAMQIGMEIAEIEEVFQAAERAAERIQEEMGEAKRRARLMEREIDDQLTECRYSANARDAIENGCKIGCGPLKGPVTSGIRRRRFQRDEAGEWTLVYDKEDIPEVQYVDPWGFFPDPDERNVRDGNGVFQLHIMNATQARKLARRDDIDKKALKHALEVGGSKSLPHWMIELHNMGEDTQHGGGDPRYHVWEYRGPLDRDDFESMALSMGHGKKQEKLLKVLEEMGDLLEVNATVWFSSGVLLSLAINHLDSGDCIYSVFSPKADEAGPFGYSVPYMMRDCQAILNASARMMMDNSSLSTGPQIVVDRNAIEPADGDWKIRPRKVWQKKSAMTDSRQSPPFETYNIPSMQQELLAQMEWARSLVDEVIGVPAIAQGEQGANVTKTAQGMALLMNSANVIFRRMVKNWDDDVAVPIIRRMYEYNMQFNPKDEIKGDYNVAARGASVLLVREMLAQNLMMIASQIAVDPTYGDMINKEVLLQEIFRAHMIPAEEIILTTREKTKREQQQGQQPPSAEEQAMMAEAEAKKQEIEIRMEETRLKADISRAEWDTKRAIAQMDFDAKMAMVNVKADEVDMKAGTEIAKVNTKDRETDVKRDMEETKIGVEAAMARETGEHAGGSI